MTPYPEHLKNYNLNGLPPQKEIHKNRPTQENTKFTSHPIIISQVIHESLVTSSPLVHKSSTTLDAPHVHKFTKVHKLSTTTTSSQHRNDFPSLHHNEITRVR
jgi:hypothetical protein